MYEEFYKFTGKPFKLSPDPRFFYSSTEHKRAMAYMQYGLQQEQGFIVVTGDVGTGKSMLVSNLFSLLDEKRLVAAKIVSTNVQSSDLIRLICSELGLAHDRKSKAALLTSLEARFRAEVEAGKHVLLVIDEAQNLPRESLEELRMLSNFEHNSQPLVQSFLLGQREFRRILRAPGLEQLRQRVIAAYHLGPLGENEIASYVRHRLKVVNWQGDPEIEDGVFAKVYQTTGGIPRRINTFFDRLLLNAYLDEAHVVTLQSAERVAAEVEQEMRGPEGGVDEPRAADEPPAARSEVAAAPTDSERMLNQRLERLERQLGVLSAQLSERAVLLAESPHPIEAVASTAEETKRWTVAFLALSVSVVTAIGLAAYLVFG